jgi:hypothetical protein
MVILPADIEAIKDIKKDDIFQSLLGLRLDDLSKISCPFSANSFPFYETFLERRNFAREESRVC